LAMAGGAYWPVAVYMMVLTVIGLASIWGLAETRKPAAVS